MLLGLTWPDVAFYFTLILGVCIFANGWPTFVHINHFHYYQQNEKDDYNEDRV